MCGICGFINLGYKPIGNTNVILKMLKEQKHRGPDDSGIVAFSLKSGCARELPVNRTAVVDDEFEGMLGFNRLSILDLSMNGHQPMVSPDGNVILTLNGEIYNAFDYKKELQDYGFKFKSTSDTEIVLYLYLKFGIEGMLNRLNGMFAIALADLRERRLLVVRDRFGIKPMYYLNNQKVFAFSSELKSFTHLPDFLFELDHNQLDEYLLFRNNLNGTLFKDIQALMPGQYISFTGGHELKFSYYFDINVYSRNSITPASLQESSFKIKEALSRSVGRQLISDVKLGCQLSGGIDSSLVTLLANSQSEKGSFEAVSIVFNDSRFSEEKYIDQVTNLLGIRSHKFVLDSDYYLKNIEKATWHLEFPLNHPNTVAIYRLSECAKEYVTVLLSGEGADEVFAGYERFFELTFPYKVRRILSVLKQNMESPQNMLRYFNPQFRAIMATSFMKPNIAKRIRHKFHFENAIESRKMLYESLKGSLFDRQIKYEIKTYLPDLLIRQDKMSMAHSIENRVPFLDNELVQESFNIPKKLLIPNKQLAVNTKGKYLLKEICGDFFGDEFAFRDKMGFGIPLREFFSDSKFKEYLMDKILPAIKDRGIFDYRIISGWSSGISGLNNDEIDALWLIIAFEIWATLYLD